LDTVFGPPLGAWGDLDPTHTVHLRLIEKLVVDFLFVLIELVSPGVTDEAVRANIDWKSAQLNGVLSFSEIFMQ